MFIYDLHVHTSEVSSCGVVGAKEMVNLYKEKGYAGVVVTDHIYPYFFASRSELSYNECCDLYFSGFEEARREGQKLGLDIFPGLELSLEENPNDYLVFGLPMEFIYENPGLTSWSLGEFREKTEEFDRLIIQAHPFRPHMVITPPELLDGVEVFNGNERHNSRNHIAKTFAEDHQLIQVSGSDFHQIEDLARGGILTDEKVTDVSHLIDILKNGRYRLIFSSNT